LICGKVADHRLQRSACLLLFVASRAADLPDELGHSVVHDTLMAFHGGHRFREAPRKTLGLSEPQCFTETLELFCSKKPFPLGFRKSLEADRRVRPAGHQTPPGGKGVHAADNRQEAVRLIRPIS
jgi:hypothetical protein